MRMDNSMLYMLSKMARETGEALSEDRERLNDAIKNIVQREIEVEVWKTIDGQRTKIKEKRLNNLDNMLPRIYEIAMRSTGLREVPPFVFSNMVKVQGYLRRIYSMRKKITDYQAEIKEFKKKQGKKENNQEEQESESVVHQRQPVEVYLEVISKQLGINLKTVDPGSLWKYEEEVFLNFLSVAVQLVLLRIVPNIARDIGIPVTFGEPTDELGPDPFKTGRSESGNVEKYE